MNGALVNYDEGRRRLALAHSHDEVAEIRDKAAALTQYARQAKDTELLAWVSEIKVRAERRAGQLIREQQNNGKLAKRGGDRKSNSQPASLKSADITQSDSSRWQKMAAIPEEQFESVVATAKDHIGEVTTAFVLRETRPNRPPQEKHIQKKVPLPLWKQQTRDGQLCRFFTVVRGCEDIVDLGLTPREWLHDSPPELRQVVGAAIAPAIAWLIELKEITP